MVILQFILGFIMGIYLTEILTDHWATKKVLTALKRRGSPPKGEKTITTKTI
jgi:ABC-type phosphate transport system permease subunit